MSGRAGKSGPRARGATGRRSKKILLLLLLLGGARGAAGRRSKGPPPPPPPPPPLLGGGGAWWRSKRSSSPSSSSLRPQRWQTQPCRETGPRTTRACRACCSSSISMKTCGGIISASGKRWVEHARLSVCIQIPLSRGGRQVSPCIVSSYLKKPQ